MSVFTMRSFQLTILSMVNGMLALGKDFKIAQSVVRLITVSVMDNFVVRQFSANRIFHDKAMHKNKTSYPFDSSFEIPIKFINSAREPISNGFSKRIAAQFPTLVMRPAPATRNSPVVAYRACLIHACIIASLVGLAQGCATRSTERLATLETTNCDPFQRKDCWSVSEQFVRERLNLEEQLIRTKDALRTCREKL